MNQPFDEGFFSPIAEGNLGIEPSTYLTDPGIRNTGDRSWSPPRLPVSSIMAMRAPTLNSFSAFSASNLSMPSDWVEDKNTGVFHNKAGAQVAIDNEDGTADGLGKFAGNTYVIPDGGVAIVAAPATPAPTAAPATSGNSVVDSISGLLRGTVQATTPTITAAAQQQMQLFLQGKLPGYQLNPTTGQLEKKTDWGMIAMVGGGLGLLLFAMMK